MGMDLLLNFVWADKDVEPDWDGARKHIESLTAEEANDAYVGTGQADFYTWDEYKERLLRAHDNIKSAWFDDCDRSTFLVDIGKYKVLVTGGDSWGDSPSEMFDDIQDWGNIPGLDKFGFYKDWERHV
jgi:hypothetical protein